MTLIPSRYPADEVGAFWETGYELSKYLTKFLYFSFQMYFHFVDDPKQVGVSVSFIQCRRQALQICAFCATGFEFSNFCHPLCFKNVGNAQI